MTRKYARPGIKPTKREVQIVDMAALGLTFKEIGGKLGISESTVEAHAYNIRSKLGVHNMAQAFRVLITRGHIRLKVPLPIDKLNRLIEESIREAGKRVIDEWKQEAA